MKNRNLLEGLLLLMLSSFFINESIKLRGNEALALSPALFPLIITVSLFVLSLIVIVSSFKKQDIKKQSGNIRQVLFTIAISFIYLLMLPRIHFIFSSIIYISAFSVILGERRWKVVVPISVIAPLLIYFIFGNLLSVLLP